MQILVSSRPGGSANGSTPSSNGYVEKAAAKPAAAPAGAVGRGEVSGSNGSKGGGSWKDWEDFLWDFRVI